MEDIISALQSYDKERLEVILSRMTFDELVILNKLSHPSLSQDMLSLLYRTIASVLYK